MNPLQQHLLSNAPREFFESLASKQQALYGEAKSLAYDTPLWGEPEAESVFPIARRAVFEAELRRTSKAMDIRWEDQRHHGDNYGYVAVYPGSLLLTGHHVDRPRRFVRPCSSRKQNAAVNRLSLQPCLEEILLEPLPSLEGIVNAHILHGLIKETIDGRDQTKSFMTIAYPHPDQNKYVYALDILEVLQLHAAQPVDTGEGTVVLTDDLQVTLKPDAAEVDAKLEAKNKSANRKRS